MELVKSKEAPPLYVQIKNDIKLKLEEGIWKPGDLIPGEPELCNIYSVSRITVRDAIAELVTEKYLEKYRGRGTFVLERQSDDKEFSTRVRNFTYEMKEQGYEVHTLKANIKLLKTDTYIADKLGLRENEQAFLLLRTRGSENNPIVYFKTYLHKDLELALDSKKYYKSSLYDILEKKGVVISRISESLSAVIPDKETCAELNIDSNTPVLKRCRIAADQNKRVIEYTEGYYNCNKYEYYIDFYKSR